MVLTILNHLVQIALFGTLFGVLQIHKLPVGSLLQRQLIRSACNNCVIVLVTKVMHSAHGFSPRQQLLATIGHELLTNSLANVLKMEHTFMHLPITNTSFFFR